MLPRSSVIFLATSLLVTFPVQAQLIPDHTLGTENSVVVPIETLRQHIEGGATRGANLFHSFQEFNVGENQQVYFTNPATIHNILTRVTGNNSSDILGKLGVLGEANLWLINPNGIYFGPNASLDIRGSFVATTADGVWLGNNGYFSATDVNGSKLLSVEPGALFSNAMAAHQRKITNRGNLSVGGNLTFAAGYLDFMGEVQAKGNVSLQALDTLKIRDTAENPFIAKAGGDLLIQGNNTVDIFALNHPNSGLFSGRDLILQSPNPVLGDAHYYSGGDFRIQSDNTGSLGDLESPDDPIIRAAGDVTLNSYTGASLHIIAGGSVKITGDVNITGADPTNGLQETVTLSDGTTLAINGKTTPTLDIRAGTTNVGTAGCTGTCPTFTTGGSATSADIEIGGNVTASNGNVFLSNQYFPNSSLSSGNISVNGITTGGGIGSGSITIDTRNNLTVNGSFETSIFNISGEAGKVTILAGNNTRFDGTNNSSSGISTGFFGNVTGRAGDITIKTGNLELLNGSQLGAFNFGSGDGGDITITASDTIRFQGENSQGNISGVDSSSLSQNNSNATGNAGNITINTTRLEVLDGGRISTIASGQGNAGDVKITASDTIKIQGESSNGTISGIGSQVASNGTGSGGDITINTARLEVLDGAQIDASTSGQGNGGNVDITASDTILVQGASKANIPGGFGSEVSSNASGNAGNVTVRTSTLQLFDNAGISGRTFGQGNGGNIFVNADNININNEAGITTQTSGTGNAGSIFIKANDIELNNESEIQASSTNSGLAGNINITGNNLTLRGDSPIKTDTDTVDGGNININLQGILLLRNSSDILTDAGLAGAGGNGGNITITAKFVIAVPGENSDIGADAFEGNGGNINITANAIYGLEFREDTTIFSDITASSQFGQNGILVFNPLSFPSEQGLNELPENLVDAESIIGRDACKLQDGRIAGGSSFTVTGRGGIPTSPDEPLTNAPYIPEWSNLEGDSEQPTVILRDSEPTEETASIRPAQGWYVSADGTVHLTADASEVTVSSPVLSHPDCNNLK